MARPIRHTDTAPGWINRRFADLQRQINQERAAKRLPGSEIAAGNTFNVRGLLSILGGIQIIDDEGSVVWSALDGPLKVASAQANEDTADFPDYTWDLRLESQVPIPDGYTQAQVLMFVNAGCTGTGTSGLVGVYPNVNGTDGPHISNGNGGGGLALSVASFFATTLTGLSVTDTVDLKAYAYKGGAVAAGSCNTHLSASVLFLR
jgi:hypothetical protein